MNIKYLFLNFKFECLTQDKTLWNKCCVFQKENSRMEIVILLLYTPFRMKTNEDKYVRERFCKKKEKKHGK